MNFKNFIEENELLIHKISHRYNIQGFTHEDLYQEGLMKLFDVFDRYDSTKGAPSTFITNILNNFYSSLVRYYNTRERKNYDSNNNMLKEIKEKDFNFDSLSIEENILDTIYKEKIFNLVLELLKKEKYGKAFYQRMLYGETFQSLADKLGVSKQNIAQRYKVFLQKVQKRVADFDSDAYSNYGE